MIRPSGFSPTRVMARQLANCVLCPRGFEKKVCLKWLTLPVCQGCFIRKMDERNNELNAKIQSQQTKASDEKAEIPVGSNPISSGDKTVDTCQGSDGAVNVPASAKVVSESRPGIHSPQVADSTASSCAVHEEQRVRLPHSAVSKPVDTQSQDWPNRKAAEVQHPCTFSSPDIDNQVPEDTHKNGVSK